MPQEEGQCRLTHPYHLSSPQERVLLSSCADAPEPNPLCAWHAGIDAQVDRTSNRDVWEMDAKWSVTPRARAQSRHPGSCMSCGWVSRVRAEGRESRPASAGTRAGKAQAPGQTGVVLFPVTTHTPSHVQNSCSECPEDTAVFAQTKGIVTIFIIPIFSLVYFIFVCDIKGLVC